MIDGAALVRGDADWHRTGSVAVNDLGQCQLPDGSSSCGHRADPLAVFVWMSALTQPESIRKSFLTCAYTLHMQSALDTIVQLGNQAVPPHLLRSIAPTSLEGINLRGTFDFPIADYAERLMPGLNSSIPFPSNRTGSS